MANTKSANIATFEYKTNNLAIIYDWQSSPISALCDIFNMDRYASEIDIISKLPLVWSYRCDENIGELYIALMFYMRSIRKIDNVPKGKGEKLLSYYMLLWLLSNFKLMFMSNYFSFIRDIGCYKDCLHLAKLAKEKKYSDDDIRLLLMPMAVALMEDENYIIQAHLSNTITIPKLSLASKWAPREGKAFTSLIPYLKQLCNITGGKTDMKWRKYIQQITFGNTNNHTIEKLLSTKQYDKVNFNAVPSKAFNLYKNAFARIPELSNKFANFLSKVKTNSSTNNHVSTIQPHDILNTYISTHVFGLSMITIKQDEETEAHWKCYMNNALKKSLNLDREQCNFIPMIDISESMFMIKALPAKVAITLGIIMSSINTNLFKRKTITFSSKPAVVDIVGDTAFDQINSLFTAVSQTKYGSFSNTNFVGALKALLQFLLKNEVPAHEVEKIKIIAFSDTEYDTSPLESIHTQYAEHFYKAPQIIFWNLNVNMKHKPCKLDDNGVICLYGFEPSVIDVFLDSGVLDTTTIPVQIVKKYLQLVIR